MRELTQAATEIEGSWGAYLGRLQKRVSLLTGEWETDRARLWNDVHFKIAHLTAELAASMARLEKQVGTLKDPTRKKAIQVFQWISRSGSPDW